MGHAGVAYAVGRWGVVYGGGEAGDKETGRGGDGSTELAEVRGTRTTGDGG